MSKPKDADEQGWDRGWEQHEARQLRRLSQLSLVEKLDWLEEAQVFGQQLIAQSDLANKAMEEE